MSATYRRIAHGICLVWIAILVLTACGGPTTPPPPRFTIDSSWLAPGLDVRGWPTFGHDDAHSGVYPVLRSTPALRGQIAWHYGGVGPIFSSPVLAYGTLFVGSTGGNLLALDATTGAVIWRHNIGQFLDDSTPVVVGRVVFVAANRSWIFALDRTTGQQLWTANLGEVIQAAPIFADGLLLVNSRTTTFALDARGGTIRWHFHENASGWPTQAAPTVQGNTVYCALGTTTVVYALNLQTGAKIWSHDAGVRLISTPLVTGQSVIIGTWNGLVMALDASSGALLWRYDVNSALAQGSPTDGIAGSPAATSDLIFIGTYSGNVLALDATTGHVRWTHGIASPVLGVPVFAGDTLYVSGGQSLYALSASNGTPLWHVPLGDIRADLALGPGHLYAGTVQGDIYAVA
ncbi:MAG TPA: PQQ-binding-like beta-propeller repeat protein [Ktedonobacterales bacterium]|nr:PQQ-binding-like beta-propeller repeat protein [Ktedonobacterales bacterium]